MNKRVLMSLAALSAATIFLLPDVAHAEMFGDLTGDLQSSLDAGNYAFALVLVYAAGLATAFTPCVYPMIAITVSVFGARQAKSRLQGAGLSLMFVLGIAALFTPLGVVSAMTGSMMGAALQSTFVLGFLAVLFVAMALSMFGAWDMNLPPALQNRLAQAGGVGPKGAFIIGFVNGIIAAPCTGPVLVVLLTWIGTTGDVAFGALALFIYALGLGTLFFFVGTFAVSLPKSGKWLDGVKSAFGIVFIVLAVYYLRTKVPFPRPAMRDDLWLYIPPVLLLVGLGLGAVHLSFKDSSVVEKARKFVGVTLSVVGAVGMIFYLQALPPGAHIEWLDDYEAARTLATESGRPLLVDFGAEWCGACQELDHGALSDPRVVAEAQRFVTVRIDMTDQLPEQEELLQSYNQPGLPFVVMHHTEGEEAHRVTGPMEADEFLDLLQQTN